MRAAHALGAATPPTFDLWRVPGRKRLALGGTGLTLLAEVSAQRLRVSLADDLADGAAYACTVPLGPGLRGQLDAFNAQARVLQSQAPAAAPVRAATRAALLHFRALQALDGAQHQAQPEHSADADDPAGVCGAGDGEQGSGVAALSAAVFPAGRAVMSKNIGRLSLGALPRMETVKVTVRYLWT